MDYLRKFSSLEERASTQVAMNLCQDNGFKEVALCLEKPTYGAFINEYASCFVTDSEKLSKWSNMKEAGVKVYDRLFIEFIHSCSIYDKESKEHWDAAIDDQCQRLTEGLPRFIQHGVHACMNRIALEYLSYSRRQEALFGVSRYFLMDVFTKGDWTKAGRLDEEKLTERLLEDERLTVFQRYRIACVYCLHVNISQLWPRLTQEEKKISGIDNGYISQESHPLVSFWSRQMSGLRMKVKQAKNNLWTYAAQKAIRYGNQTAVMSCWKRLGEHTRQRMVMNMALQSLKKWQSTLYEYGKYRELMQFFLSEMDEEQQLTFFKKAFQKSYCDSVLESFLDWPYQDDFLPTINRLWGIMPKDKYGKCLLTLAKKCSRDDNKEHRYYDYRSLLWMLWNKTPEEYKQYVFRQKKLRSQKGVYLGVLNEGEILLPWLLERSPFQERDETLFKEVFRYQPQEKRGMMMRSKVGENICSILTQKEMWSFLNWLLQECLPKEDISSYKKQFIQSDCCQNLCCSKLKENRERFVEDLIDWSFTLDAERTQYKYELIKGNNFLYACETLLIEGKFTEMERLINFCLSSDTVKEQFKVHLARCTCSSWLKTCKFRWEQMDKILAWSVGAEEKTSDFKKDLFCDVGIHSHYESVFKCGYWKEIQGFYKWFGLSSEEIKKLKKDTMFSDTVIDDIEKDLYKCRNSYVQSLLYCVTDRKMIMDFKKEVEKKCFKNFVYKYHKNAIMCLNHLVSELLYSFEKKEVQDKTSGDCVFLKDKGKKRSIVTEDESSSPRKQFKSVRSVT